MSQDDLKNIVSVSSEDIVRIYNLITKLNSSMRLNKNNFRIRINLQ